MAQTSRWITKTIEQAQDCSVKLPWERGLRREAFVTTRRATSDLPPLEINSRHPAA